MSLAAACIAVLPGLTDTSSWGVGNPSSVTLRGDAEAVAVVEFANTVTRGGPWLPETLTVGDLTITFSIDFGPGNISDVITVEVPDPYIVVPHRLVVEDETIGVLRIYCAADMSIG
jgi:hypothetical protein